MVTSELCKVREVYKAAGVLGLGLALSCAAVTFWRIVACPSKISILSDGDGFHCWESRRGLKAERGELHEHETTVC